MEAAADLFIRISTTAAKAHNPIRNVLSSGIWNPVYGQSWPRVAKELLAGWRVSGILTMESGDSLTAVNGGPGTPCPATDAGTSRCPTGYGSSAQDGAGFDELNVSGNPNIGHSRKTPCSNSIPRNFRFRP